MLTPTTKAPATPCKRKPIRGRTYQIVGKIGDSRAMSGFGRRAVWWLWGAGLVMGCTGAAEFVGGATPSTPPTPSAVTVTSPSATTSDAPSASAVGVAAPSASLPVAPAPVPEH